MLRQAAITVIQNYSVLFLDKDGTDGRIQAISALGEASKSEKDGTNYLRMITALGNLQHQFPEGKELMVAVGVQVDLKGLEGADQKSMEFMGKIISEMGF